MSLEAVNKKIGLALLLLTLVVYVVSQVYYYYNGKEQVHMLPPEGKTVVEFNHYAKNHKTNIRILRAYIANLSSLQTKDIIRSIGVSNLSSEKAQKQFLKCAGTSILTSDLPVHIPPTHQNCKKMSFQSSGASVLLTSFAGSGNSWVRQLLEAATGVYTGAFYCDKSYVEEGMIGEGVTTENVIAVKTHDAPYMVTRHSLKYDKAIHIVRSPFPAILSETTRLHANKNHNRHIEVEHSYKSYANNTQWEKEVKRQAMKWKRLVYGWLILKKRPVLIVGYENLVNDTYTELKRMLDFIGYPYSRDDILCAVKNSGEGFHRHHTKKDYNPFSSKLQEFVLNQIKELDPILLDHNISLYYPYTI